jgi:hypothetical protein
VKTSPLKKILSPFMQNAAPFARLTSSDPGEINPVTKEPKQPYLRQSLMMVKNITIKNTRASRPESKTPKNSLQTVRKSLKDTTFFKMIIQKPKKPERTQKNKSPRDVSVNLYSRQTTTPNDVCNKDPTKSSELIPKKRVSLKIKKKPLKQPNTTQPKHTCYSSMKTLQSVINSAKSIRHSTGTAVGLPPVSGFMSTSDFKSSQIQVPETGNSKTAKPHSKQHSILLSNIFKRIKGSKVAESAKVE